ncbi:hypothetical protein OG357_37955 [Streptomyces sp. NBC_01255]|uniref:hypothetical protein n=1 Tax=Streptomyces sp. NBC_01255 TaxID=2903798 RepID=UPI002E37469C|nr:hypothetical protein [Streptomyces sp. NBC_01255]
MSVDVAYPVFRTPDPALALRTARRLMEFGRCECSDVSAYAEFSSVAEVRRVANAMPGGRFRGASELEEFQGVPFEDQPPFVVGVPASGLPAEEAAFEGRLPVEWEAWNLPVGSIEDGFTATIGPNVGLINWRSLQWPDAPEAGFHGESKHAEVTLLFHTRTRELDEPTDDHTVLVHVRSAVFDGRQRREPYAHWLAAQMGLTLIGPAQRC